MDKVSSELIPDEVLNRALAAERKHPDALISIMNPDGVFMYNSPSSEQILGYPEGYALGHNISEFYDQREVAHIMLAIRDALTSGESVSTTRNSPLMKGGTRRVRGMMYRIEDSRSGNLYVLSIAWPLKEE